MIHICVYVYICMYAWLCTRVCVCACMYVYVLCICTGVYLYVCIFGYVWIIIYICLCLCICVFGRVLQRYGPVRRDHDLLQEIRICARYKPDTMTIQKSTNKMIRKFVPVRAWRPEDDSDSKSRHFMWVFALI